jgi:outer membrane protein assembly factor BamA
VNCYTTVGTKALLSSTELRRQLFTSPLFTGWLEGVLFCDVGRTWDAGEAVRGRDFGVAFGPGIRVHMRQPLYFDWRAELNVIGDLAFYASARRGF